VPRLIVLNGPPAVGKSTIARRYADEHPLTLNLDIDRLRRFLGGWREQPVVANGLARDFGLAAARAHLTGGHDVVVPQYLGRVDQLARFANVAAETGADYFEFVLLDSKDRILDRFAARTAAAEDPVHLDAQLLLDRSGGALQLEAMYDRLLLVMANRPEGRLLAARTGEIDQTYRELLAAI
jgi:predicted kinase